MGISEDDRPTAAEKKPPPPQPDDAARGRLSAEPSEIPKAGWRDILIRTYKEISDDNVGLVAAGVAFYGLLALFPAAAALVSIYGLIADPIAVQDQLNAMRGLIPQDVVGIVGDQLNTLVQQDVQALSFGFVSGLALALWSASKGATAFMEATNIAYDEVERRSFMRRTLTAIAITAFVTILMIIAVLAVVVTPAILAFLDFGKAFEWFVSLLRWPFLAGIFMLALSALYRFGPSRQPARWQWVTWGSVASTILWLLASALFSIYVANFASYNETYGSLGAVVGMMMWFWVSAYIVMFGAELNAEMEHQTKCDTTTGPEKPIGARGAYVADTVGNKP